MLKTCGRGNTKQATQNYCAALGIIKGIIERRLCRPIGQLHQQQGEAGGATLLPETNSKSIEAVGIVLTHNLHSLDLPLLHESTTYVY